MKVYDILWKLILEVIFDDFLYFFFPNDVETIDLEKGFVFLDKELESLFNENGDVVSPRFVDKLVKLFLKSGEEKWILIHIEVQGYNDPNFSQRMFTYYSRIWDKFQMPITSVAIFTDNQKNYHPKSFETNFMGTSVLYKFNTYKVLNQDEALLRQSDNPFAIVILVVLLALKKKPEKDEELYDLKMSLLKHLLEMQFSREKIISLLQFLKHYVRFENNDLNDIFEEKMNLLTTKNVNDMDINELMLIVKKEEGKREGREIEREVRSRKFVINLLNEGIYTDEKIASLVDVTLEFVKEVKQSIQ